MDQINWLFLRGLTREKRHWGEFLEKFLEFNPKDKILCLDLPGFGSEHKKKSPFSVREIMLDLKNRFSTESKKENYLNSPSWAVLGISLGGMVALEWMSHFPEDFRMGVVINSSAGNLSTPFERLKPERLKDIVKSRFISNVAKRERLILEMTTNRSRNLDIKAKEWAQIYQDKPYRSQNAIRQLTAATFFQAPSRIRSELLFLSSSRDQFTDPICSKELALFYESQHCVHPDGGHDLTTDDPAWVGEQVGLFRSHKKSK